MIIRIYLVLILVIACLFSCSENLTESTSIGGENSLDKDENSIEKINLKVEIMINKVGVLAKRSSIKLKQLELTLTTDGEETVTRIIVLAGHSEAHAVTEEFSLAGNKVWTIHAKTVDMHNVGIHETVVV